MTVALARTVYSVLYKCETHRTRLIIFFFTVSPPNNMFLFPRCSFLVVNLTALRSTYNVYNAVSRLPASFSIFSFYPLCSTVSRPVLKCQNTHNASGPCPCIDRNPIPLEECGKLWPQPNRETNQPVSRQIVYL